MFHHLLVPLDGSLLAEAALPVAASLAATFGADITLVHIIEKHAPRAIHGERHLTSPDEASDYLDRISASAFPPGMRISCHVHTVEVTDVAESIADHAGELSPDLVVMCAHGNDMLRNWLTGSIAQHVIARRTVPVLCIKSEAKGPGGPSFHCGTFLVPLDGNTAHEHGIAFAAELAATCKSMLHLISVVPTTGTLRDERRLSARMMPVTAASVLDLAELEASEYLRTKAGELEAQGVEVTTEVRRGSPAHEIDGAARHEGAVCVVLATHGKTGLDAFWSGSMTPRLAQITAIPILLVPVP